jgi:cation transport regulator ChaC
MAASLITPPPPPAAPPAGEIACYIFGYGSLCWKNNDFAYSES